MEEKNWKNCQKKENEKMWGKCVVWCLQNNPKHTIEKYQ